MVGGGTAGGAWMGGAPGGRPVPLGHNSVMNGTINEHYFSMILLVLSLTHIFDHQKPRPLIYNVNSLWKTLNLLIPILLDSFPAWLVYPLLNLTT